MVDDPINAPVPEHDLRCPQCNWQRTCGAGAMLSWLRTVGMVRRDAAPGADLLPELFRAAAPKFRCPQCGATGLAAQVAKPLDDEEWGQTRSCESCGKPIDALRLEALPDSRQCVACQRRQDAGESGQPEQYCPKCGGIMKTRLAGGGGIARYVLACTTCRR